MAIALTLAIIPHAVAKPTAKPIVAPSSHPKANGGSYADTLTGSYGYSIPDTINNPNTDFSSISWSSI